ncbi:beta-phosphoglucomutase [Weissella confusa]|uniref:beta-phosphoglucomutase n=1 Tax=Weissella confusa TaxID=1583 RepID=UPI0018F1B8F4|nr:beta-phosphoglucomutase [Weissella confusa]MBJ7623674.1 beta-phosphoglucomutase [Weissella confusa]MBJ7648815.1 beta-phosphoglucomutase [Weissella confusa]MBJ7656710.1 beta-phosphoglucomutase [Weissella confusa]MBJ7664726.1 beta-phosphoglucomutase [Weissella confusa]MBJ7675218.1 beta-phosphoglucomutase [Weissella confusa]
MTKFSEIKGFAFDLDGVITDTAKFHTQAWHALADQVNVTWTPELQESLKGIDRMGSLEMILKAGNKQDDYTHDEKVALASWKNNHYVELISGLTPDDILPGMADFIKELNDKCYKASVASASKNAPFILDRLQLTDSFVGIVDPSTLTANKPDPEIYVRAAELLNLPPEQVIGLEDAASGIQAINGAGEVSLGIGNAEILHDADIRFDATADVTLANIAAKLD